MVSGFEVYLALKRLFQIVRVFRDFAFFSASVLIFLNQTFDVGSKRKVVKLIRHDRILQLLLIRDITGGHPMMIPNTGFSDIVPDQHGRYLIGIRSLHLREDVPDLGCIERMFRNRVRKGNSAKPPPFVLDIFQVKSLENEIRDFFEHNGVGY